MAAYDWENGPLPDLPAYKVVDAMGTVLHDLVFMETESGFTVRLQRGADGNFLINPDTFGIVRVHETRPAPIRLVPC